MRCFVGIPLPEDPRAAAADVAAALRDVAPGARWVDPATYHLTLAFLGAVDASAVPGLAEALGRSLAAAEPFGVALGGAGAFPSPRRPRVVWVGVADGGAALQALAGAAWRALAPLGFEAADRPHHPHLTLARVRRPLPAPELAAALAGQPQRCGPAWWVNEVTLFESILGPGGARHHPLARVRLGT